MKDSSIHLTFIFISILLSSCARTCDGLNSGATASSYTNTTSSRDANWTSEPLDMSDEKKFEMFPFVDPVEEASIERKENK